MASSPLSKKLGYWFIFQRDRLLVSKDQGKLLTSPSINGIKNFFLRHYLLGQREDFDIYCAEVPNDMSLPEQIDSIPFRKALELLGPDWYNVAAKAYAIINWDKNHQFCGRCGHITAYKPTTFERVCTVCSLTFYPRISPSIIVLIQKDDQILMARSYHFIPGAYGLIAGFVESGESVEDAVHREVHEEVGIKIKNLRYFGSQSWPFPDSLMIAFTAEYASGELIINHTEIEEAGWYPFDHLPGGPSTSISIARKLIDHFISEQKKKYQL
jgi:NAD+ diphosphatase